MIDQLEVLSLFVIFVCVWCMCGRFKKNICLTQFWRKSVFKPILTACFSAIAESPSLATLDWVCKHFSCLCFGRKMKTCINVYSALFFEKKKTKTWLYYVFCHHLLELKMTPPIIVCMCFTVSLVLTFSISEIIVSKWHIYVLKRFKIPY